MTCIGFALIHFSPNIMKFPHDLRGAGIRPYTFQDLHLIRFLVQSNHILVVQLMMVR